LKQFQEAATQQGLKQLEKLDTAREVVRGSLAEVKLASEKLDTTRDNLAKVNAEAGETVKELKELLSADQTHLAETSKRLLVEFKTKTKEAGEEVTKVNAEAGETLKELKELLSADQTKLLAETRKTFMAGLETDIQGTLDENRQKVNTAIAKQFEGSMAQVDEKRKDMQKDMDAKFAVLLKGMEEQMEANEKKVETKLSEVNTKLSESLESHVKSYGDQLDQMAEERMGVVKSLYGNQLDQMAEERMGMFKSRLAI